jgi:hypothetical protein
VRKVRDWEGGSLKNAHATSKKSGMNEENISSGKEKEKDVEVESDDDDPATLMLFKFGRYKS